MSTATNVTQLVAPRNAHVQDVIAAAEHELHQLLQQRSETMKRIGTIKQKPGDWKDTFFPELHAESGS